MAAVAVFGLVYVVIARAAIGGLSIEGEANRRMEASLLADQALHELETQLLAETSPRLGRTEESVGPFDVLVEVAPLDPTAIGLEIPTPAPATSSREGQDLRDRPRGGVQVVPSLLAPARGRPPALLALFVSVSWLEGGDRLAVTRTSFGFDAAAAAPLLDSIPDEEPGGTTDEQPAFGEDLG
jgi:hypothetical protein